MSPLVVMLTKNERERLSNAMPSGLPGAGAGSGCSVKTRSLAP